MLSLLVIAGASAQEPAGSPPRPPGREMSLPSSEVKDTFFAWFLGLIAHGAQADVDNGQMREILPEFTSLLNVPFELISRFSLSLDPGTGAQRAELDFQKDIVVPVPFALLFYHPGTVALTRAVLFDVVRSTMSAADADADGTVGSPVFFLTLSDGSIFIDIHDWLESLFSEQLEDAWITNVVFFRWRGDWVGMLVGRGDRTLRFRSAYFDFTTDTIIFPVPDSLSSIGRALGRESSQP